MKAEYIIVKIMGGLGNQLFQYAFARKISIQNNVHVKLDISHFENENVYKSRYTLNRFKIIEDIATDSEIKMFIYGKYEKGLTGIYAKVINKILPIKYKKVIEEKSGYFNPSILRVNSNKYFCGYWAKYKYFDDIRSTLIKEININQENNLEVYNELKKEIISADQSVSVHLRRGYKQKVSDMELFGTLPIEYYKNALEYISTKIKAPTFYIFSDDIQWSKENLNINKNFKYINLGPSGDYLELKLMNYCKHNIIANSTFSWWGAWLNENPQKIVIAPKRWYKNKSYQKKYENGNFIPEDWIKF